MPSDQWQRAEEIFHRALELEPEQRRAFLDEQCSGDDELRREVESLIEFDRKAQHFIESPAAQVAGRLLCKQAGQSGGRAPRTLPRTRQQFPTTA